MSALPWKMLFGLPPLEAMACGLPVIVSNRAGISEIVTDGVDGLVLNDPKDANSLAKMISTLCSDRGLRFNLGKAAATTARQYTWERNAARTRCPFRTGARAAT